MTENRTAECPAFAGLPDDQIAWFLSQAEELRFKAGDPLMNRGRSGRRDVCSSGRPAPGARRIRRRDDDHYRRRRPGDRAAALFQNENIHVRRPRADRLPHPAISRIEVSRTRAENARADRAPRRHDDRPRSRDHAPGTAARPPRRSRKTFRRASLTNSTIPPPPPSAPPASCATSCKKFAMRPTNSAGATSLPTQKAEIEKLEACIIQHKDAAAGHPGHVRPRGAIGFAAAQPRAERFVAAGGRPGATQHPTETCSNLFLRSSIPAPPARRSSGSRRSPRCTVCSTKSKAAPRAFPTWFWRSRNTRTWTRRPCKTWTS